MLLNRAETVELVEQLLPYLTARQHRRLSEIREILDSHGVFILRDALKAAQFAGNDSQAQDKFQDFRRAMNTIAEANGIDLRLELDARKVRPDHRRGWFTGGDIIEKAITTHATQESALTRPEKPLNLHAVDPSGDASSAVDRIVAWATDDDPSAPRVCMLHGDPGAGKTTTAKLTVQSLLQLHRSGAAPLPILLDLRNVRIAEPDSTISLDRVLDDTLDASRPTGVARERLDARAIRTRLDKGNAVIVFDGLDAVLVHLSARDRAQFMRQLRRAISSRSTTRMLLTCRTNYFRDTSDQNAHLTGDNYLDLRPSDYLTLRLQPLIPDQIGEYLFTNHDPGDAVDILRTAGITHPVRVPGPVDIRRTPAAQHSTTDVLADLMAVPLTLRLVAEQAPVFRRAARQGRNPNMAAMLEEIVHGLVSWDATRCGLTGDHKILLMTKLVVEMRRREARCWTAVELDEWLAGMFDEWPALHRHYREHRLDARAMGLRAGVFLAREAGAFRLASKAFVSYALEREHGATPTADKAGLDVQA